MARRIALEFDNGRTYTAELLEAEAPYTCQRVWEALPIEVGLGHGIATGMALAVHIPDLNVDRQENTMVFGMAPGDVLLNTRVRDGWQNLRIICGPSWFLSFQTGWEPCNRFASIVDPDLSDLVAIWREVHANGMQRVRIRTA